MAEREGFEPPIPLRVCLISSQVHTTGLCHLSAYFQRLISRWKRTKSPTVISGFGSGFPPLRAAQKASITSLANVIRSRYKVRIPHCHLNRRIPDVHDCRRQRYQVRLSPAACNTVILVPGLVLDPGRFESEAESSPAPTCQVDGVLRICKGECDEAVI